MHSNELEKGDFTMEKNMSMTKVVMPEQDPNVRSREELIGDIVALLQSPAKNVISALQGSAGHKIAGLVKALEERNN